MISMAKLVDAAAYQAVQNKYSENLCIKESSLLLWMQS
jgi:hypothetical protein